jgi:Pyruvate/2-oxoacid:ferredoxin oxidoreductase delta subunit
MMGCDPGRLRFLQKAKESGLGDDDLSKIEVIGEMKPLPGFKLPPLGGEAILSNTAIRDFMESRTRLRPQVDPESCTSCGTCIDHCTVSALSFSDKDLPQVDADACITCFCCQEMCPEKAITLR